MPDIEELSARMLDAVERLRGRLWERRPELEDWGSDVMLAMDAVAREMPSSVLTAALEHREEVLTVVLDKSWQESGCGHIVSFQVHSGTLVSRAWVEDRVLCVRVEQGVPKPFSVRMATLDVYLVPQHQAVRGDLFAVGAAAGMPIAVPRGFVREPS